MAPVLFLIAAALLCGAPGPVGAGPPVALSLWPGLAPGETTSSTGTSAADATGRYGPITRLTVVTSPQMVLYPMDDSGRPRPTVLVLPGGGYYIVTTDIEGSEVARWLNSLGCNAAVLYYRVPDAAVPSPARRTPAFQDVQRAVSLLRANAQAWGVDPRHLGVIGFSAGGHLAARLAAGDGTRAYAPVDAADQASDRPDFALLVYPAYLWDKAVGQPAPEVRPRRGMPPVFLTQTRDDGLFDVKDYAAALRRAGVPTRCVVYDTGGHGYGLRLPPGLPAHRWPEEAAAWLRRRVGRP